MIAIGSIRNALWFSALLFLMACQPDKKPIATEEPPLPAPPLTERKIDLLIFKEEQKLELWGTSPRKIMVSIESCKIPSSLPIGYFAIKDFDTNTIELNLSSEFYEKKNYSLAHFDNRISFPPAPIQLSDLRDISKAIVFPSDNRTEQAFKPCFACPHWIAELYGQLAITLNQY